MDRRVLPLLLASPRAAEADETERLDRLRIQKGVFLLEQRGPSSWRSVYRFSPYNWGPYSSDLTVDLSRMEGEGLLRRRWDSGRYPEYITTQRGEDWIDARLIDVPQSHIDFAATIRGFVTTRSFSRLLRDVYAAYPRFATRSRFTG